MTEKPNAVCPSINILGRRIAIDEPPYVIAEMSANHNGSLRQALLMIETAKKCGADAIKLQTYTADTLTLDCDSEEFQIKNGLWSGRTLYQLYSEASMPWSWHAELFDYAKKIGITIFSTPFDKSSVDLLEQLNVPAYKVASFEATDLALIRYIAATGKPMIISTGMANEVEIAEAVSTAQAGGCKEIALLHCVSGYPAPPHDCNLRTILDISKRFGLVTGLSDHTIENTVAIAGVALGSSIIEKHFTLDRNGGGADDSFSMEPKDLLSLCKNLRVTWEALGSINYSLKSSELSNIKFRRSLYFVKPLKAGDLITEDSVRSIRPGFGLPPKFLDQIVGRTVSEDVDRGLAVKWSHIV